MKNLSRSVVLACLLFPLWVHSQNKVAPVKVKENFWYENSVIYNLEVGVFILSLCTCILASISCFAQWSTNTAVNNAICTVA